MYTQNELLYPHYVTPRLRDLRGAEWRALVDRVLQHPEAHEEALAFCLMMIRLNGCLACETDSYRAMRGCVMCTLQTLRRFKEPDETLLRLYEEARRDMRRHLLLMQPVSQSESIAAR